MNQTSHPGHEHLRKFIERTLMYWNNSSETYSKIIMCEFSGDPLHILTGSDSQDGAAIINNIERTKADEHRFDCCLSTTK